MSSTATALLTVCVLIAATVSLAAGRWTGSRRPAAVGGDAVQATVSALLALLLAFTVTGAADRFDTRRHLIVDETNAIGTAYLRLDLLPADAQPALRRQFAAYLDSRIAAFRLLPDLAAARTELAHGQALQRQIWAGAMAGCRRDPSFTPAAILLLPALNQMIDLTTTRTMISQMHPPAAIFFMLVLVLLGSAYFTGRALAAARDAGWPHLAGFLVLNVLVFAVILDLEYPRAGFLREESFDQALIDLRQSWPSP